MKNTESQQLALMTKKKQEILNFGQSYKFDQLITQKLSELASAIGNGAGA